MPPGWPETRYPVGQAQVRSFWLHHMDLVVSDLTSESKLSYLHRILMPVGYSALLGPIGGIMIAVNLLFLFMFLTERR